MKENAYLRWLSSNTQSIYWHDSAILTELEMGLSNGAKGMTTNPFLIGQTLSKTPESWPEIIAAGKKLKGDEKAVELISMTVTELAKKMAPFRAEGFGKGYCCAQVNPCHSGRTEIMLENAKRYATCGDNVVVKIPATRAGIEAIEECAALGMNVAATVSFTVPQVLAVGEAIQRGHARAKANGLEPGLGIAVLMIGRLDDYLRDVMYDTRAEATEKDIVWAGVAAMKRAYQIFEERKYDAVLMPAGCRGGHHISDLAGAKMIMSIAPKISEMLEGVTEFEERIDRPVDADIIDRLVKMPEFVKAYEPDGMKIDEFITFGSCNRTIDQFINDGWNVLKNI